MFNPTWLYTGVVYAGAVWIARRYGIDVPKRIAAFFYALVFVFFYPVLTQDAVSASVDLGWAHQVREGWHTPLLTNPQSAVFSPLRILGLPLSLAHATSFEAAMKVLIALTFTFLWCRRRGFSEAACAAGAVVFAFSPLTATACLAPAVLYAIDLLAERVTYARIVALSVIGAAMVFDGDLATVSLTAVLAMLYALWLSPRVLPAIGGAAVIAILLAAPLLMPLIETRSFAKPEWRTLFLAAWLAGAMLTAWVVDRIPERQPAWKAGVLFAVIAVSWIFSERSFVADAKTPIVRALDDLTEDVPDNAPFRVVGAAYGYENVRARPDAIDYLNVRYVLTAAGAGMPPQFHLRYDGADGRIFENANMLPRFFAARNVLIDFNDASFAKRLDEHRDWAQTALLEELELESPRQRDDFFRPRPPNAPVATTEIITAKPADYHLRVRAPRWSLVVSSIRWTRGWKVERNGARAEPIRVNGNFLGFAAPPGLLDVRVWYDPWTFRAGAGVAAATLIALIAYGVRRKP